MLALLITIISELFTFVVIFVLICFACVRRRPAWTDRILYRVSPNNYENVTLKVEQKAYEAHGNYMLSDHKPVTAEFVIKVSRVLTITLQLVWEKNFLNVPCNLVFHIMCFNNIVICAQVDNNSF